VHLAEHLEKVVTGEITRLIVSAPPQHGKSRLVSEMLPAFWLAKRPNEPVIVSSYASDLATSKSRATRSLIESDEFSRLFGKATGRKTYIKVREDSRAVNAWQLGYPYKGGVRAVGVGSGITGFPAVLGIIDDPHASWEEAQSLTYRQRAWEWYRTTFRTRVHENGAIVIIMTRWHSDDLVGRLLAEQADKWTVLRYPAISEHQAERDTNNKYIGIPEGQPDPIGRAENEPLAPRRFSLNALLELKQDVGSLAWGAEYQGVPRPSEGNRFKRQWFEIVETAPRNAKRVMYVDKAGTARSAEDAHKGAATASVLLARGDDGIYYVEDSVQGWYSAYEREAVIKQLAQVYKEKYGNVEIYIEQEPGSGGKESAEATIRNLAGFIIRADRPSGDKDTRLEPFAVQCEAKNVKLVRGLWNFSWLEEMSAIPNGVRRDQADATAGAFNKLTQTSVATKVMPVSGLYGKSQGRKR